MTPHLAAIARTGYAAALHGDTRCPWPIGTVGATAWGFGHSIGTLPPVVRWVFAWGLL